MNPVASQNSIQNWTNSLTQRSTRTLDGEIVQALFEEHGAIESDDPFDASMLYLLVSINYEFPPIVPKVEWSDGQELGGGAKVLKYLFDRESLQMWLDNGLKFDIKHNADEKTFGDIQRFFSRVFNGLGPA